MKVTAIRCGEDNYAYWVQRHGGSGGVLIDPSSAPEIQQYFHKHGITKVEHIFVTHKHLDHCGGLEKLKTENTKAYAGEHDAGKISGCNVALKDGETIKFDGMTITTIHVPCHTTGHVMYLIKVNDSPNEKINSVKDESEGHWHCVEYSEEINKALFTGDTIFVGGCGRFFEGTAEQMLKIMDKVNEMPEDTYIFCGHEYSFDDATFGIMVEPKNPHMINFMEKAKKAKEKNDFFHPPMLKDERNYNVFMKCRTKEIQEAVKSTDPVVCMNTLRTAKNNKSFP